MLLPMRAYVNVPVRPRTGITIHDQEQLLRCASVKAAVYDALAISKQVSAKSFTAI